VVARWSYATELMDSPCAYVLPTSSPISASVATTSTLSYALLGWKGIFSLGFKLEPLCADLEVSLAVNPLKRKKRVSGYFISGW